MTAPAFERLRPAVGDALPTRVHFPTLRQLQQYSGAARDWSAIHYDPDYARRRGFSGVIVQGFLKAALLAELATDWAAPEGWIKRFKTTYRGVDLPGDPLICRGEVTAVRPDGDQSHVDLRLWTEKRTGETTTRGEAVVVLAKESTR